MFHHLIASFLPHLPKKFIWLFSRRYISGVNLEDAVKTALLLHPAGAWTTIDRLGEFVTCMKQAEESRDAYMTIIDRFGIENLNVTYSLKPSGFGLLIDFEACYELIRQVVMKAHDGNQLVRIDMEDSVCVDREFELYHRLHAEFPNNTGIAIQSYLRRTANDLKELAEWHTPESPVNIRLCKGIYNESEKIAYKRPEEINRRYLADLEFLLSRGIYTGIATHDKELVSGAFGLIDKYHLSTTQYEFQMLYGVTPDLRNAIIEKGHHLRVYVPYGEEWFGYSTRRLKENPEMVKHIIKAMFVRA